MYIIRKITNWCILSDFYREVESEVDAKAENGRMKIKCFSSHKSFMKYSKNVLKSLTYPWKRRQKINKIYSKRSSCANLSSIQFIQMIIAHDDVFWVSRHINDFGALFHYARRQQLERQMRLDKSLLAHFWQKFIAWRRYRLDEIHFPALILILF